MHNRDSLSSILERLEKLNNSIKEALHTGSRPVGDFRNSAEYTRASTSGNRTARNSQELAEEAKAFHTNAASRASTVCSDAGDPVSSIQAYSNSSIFGDSSLGRRERTADCVFNSGHGGAGSIMEEPTAAEFRAVESSRQAVDDVTHWDWDALKREGYRRLAVVSVKVADYGNAAQAFRTALKHGRDENKPGQGHRDRDIQIQLALCYFLQGNWRLAEPLVMTLASAETDRDLQVCNLLHALSLGYLFAHSFEQARSTCLLASEKKLRFCNNEGVDKSEYWETRSLLAVIADMADMVEHNLVAEVIRENLPRDFRYNHPQNEVEFVQFHPSLIRSIFGDAASEDCTGRAELYGDGSGTLREESDGNCSSPSSYRPGDTFNESFRTKFLEFEKRQVDTAKEVDSVTRHATSFDERSPPRKRRLTRWRRPGQSPPSGLETTANRAPTIRKTKSMICRRLTRLLKNVHEQAWATEDIMSDAAPVPTSDDAGTLALTSCQPRSSPKVMTKRSRLAHQETVRETTYQPIMCNTGEGHGAFKLWGFKRLLSSRASSISTELG